MAATPTAAMPTAATSTSAVTLSQVTEYFMKFETFFTSKSYFT